MNKLLKTQINIKNHLETIEKEYIESYLISACGNKTICSEMLQMSRPTLLYKLKKHNLTHWLKEKGELSN